MKVLGIVCSPRKKGNTEIMMEEALAGAAGYGAETELWTVAGKDLKPCDACRSCIKNEGKCHINDGMQDLYPRIVEADGIIFGAPSYFESVSAQGKIVIDRLYGIYNMRLLTSKVAGVIAVGGSSGHEGVYTPFRNLIKFAHMLPAENTYGFASTKGEIRKDRLEDGGINHERDENIRKLRFPATFFRPPLSDLHPSASLRLCVRLSSIPHSTLHTPHFLSLRTSPGPQTKDCRNCYWGNNKST